MPNEDFENEEVEEIEDQEPEEEEANIAASQTDPSAHSPSPIKQNTIGDFLSRFRAYAIPAAIPNPLPKEPLVISTPGMSTVG